MAVDAVNGAVPEARPWQHTLLVVLAGVSLQVIAWVILIQLLWVHRVWYGFHDLSDTSLYLSYSDLVHAGQRVYRDFSFEYPPLALPLMLLPGTGTVAQYERAFSVEMIAICSLAAALTTWAAAWLWDGLNRPLAAAAAFAAVVFAAGAITANRYDVAVALVLAACMLFLAHRHTMPAAGALGLGVALKLTPGMLLPLVLILAQTRRRVIAALVAFTVLAFVPFVPFLGDFSGLTYMVSYHAHRPLQIESVPSTPFLIEGAVGSPKVSTGNAAGSQFIAAPGTKAVAKVAVYVALLAVAGVYVLIWRRRSLLRAAPEYVPLAALACVLAFTVCNKVLSPQFLVWTFPLVALVIVGKGAWQRAAGLLTLAAILLTQVEFPDMYWRVVALEPGPTALVVVRNFVLVIATLVTVLGLWYLPESPDSASA